MIAKFIFEGAIGVFAAIGFCVVVSLVVDYLVNKFG